MPEKKGSKMFAAGEIFTVRELMDAVSLYVECAGSGFTTLASEKILTPEVMARIDAKTEQSNDRGYIAFVLELCVRQSGAAARSRKQ